MVIGYEVQMYNDIRQIALNTNRIASCMEAAEERAQETGTVDPDSLGAMALWREMVASGDCLLGFSDWMAWQKAEEKQ